MLENFLNNNRHMIYFLKKVEKKGKEKIVPLDCQDLDTSLNVACPRSDTEGKRVGTIFYCYYVSKTSVGTGTPYYRTSCAYEYTEDSAPEALKSIYSDLSKKIEAKEATETKEKEAKEKEMKDVVEEVEKTVKKDGEGKKVEEPKKPTLLDEITGTSGLKAPKAKEGFYVSDEDWTILVRNIQKHVNTMIVGPTGCGKTSVVQEICKRMGKKLYIFDMGTMVDPISSLLGVHRLEKGASIFDYAKFTQVIKEPCVILLDELSRAPLSTMNILFSCLDDRRNLNIEIACGSGEREINVNPEVTFIATANVGSEYSGANSMDRALVNRFFLLELGCIPVKEEVSVLVSRTGIATTDASLIVKIANNIRSLCSKQEISVSLSIRETLMVAKLVSDGWTLAKAMEMVYLPLYEGSKSEGERSTVFKTISSY
jgi:MoxR-like ATPase